MTRRIPRITGTTSQAIYIRQERDEALRIKKTRALQKHVLNQYMREGMKLNGQTVPLNDLAWYLGMSIVNVIREVNKSGRLAIGDQESAYLGLVSQSISEALADRNLTMSQVQTLLASQGGEFKPFVSMTVNQAIANLMSSTKGLIEIAKMLKPANPSIQIQNNQQQNSYLPTQQISTQEAIKIIQQETGTPLLSDATKQQQLLLPYQDGLPEIIATRQQGFSLADEGQLPTKKKKSHDTRNDHIIPID